MNYKKVSPIFISVILPVLNSVHYIKECIDSILAQSLEEIELICIDAGSTDGTLEIMEEYALADTRVCIMESKKKSYGYQLNRAIQEAVGKYIGIVEADDYIDSIFYQTLYMYAEKNQFPDFVKSGFLRFMEWEGVRLFENCNRKQLHDIFGRVIKLNNDREKGVLDLNHIWSGIYRRDFLLQKDIKLNESSGASYQDLGFSLLVGLLADSGIFIEESYYYYRIDNAESSVKSYKKWGCVIDEFHYVMHEVEKKKLDSWEIKKLIWLQKPSIYLWNISRLPEKERYLFFDKIQEELLEYGKYPNFLMSLNDEQNTTLERLQNKEKLDEYFNKKEQMICEFKQLIKMIKKGEKFVLVSAGTYGKRMILFQDMIHIKYIEAVADNDIERQGKIWNKYILLSINEAVQRHTANWFLITNRKSSKLIKNTLVQLGVNEKKILEFHDMLPLNELIYLLKR